MTESKPGRVKESRIIEGAVSDLQGLPIEGAELHIWHSDPKGFYSGYEQNFPINFYRGKKLRAHREVPHSDDGAIAL
jgi:protocatechuate 3,4-dioxygenase beta subunit